MTLFRYVHPQFVADVMRPLKVEEIMDQEVQNLSGGELQRLAMALCLGKPADVYLVSESGVPGILELIFREIGIFPGGCQWAQKVKPSGLASFQAKKSDF